MFQVLHDGSKELSQNDKEFSKYILSSENKVSICSMLNWNLHSLSFSLYDSINCQWLQKEIVYLASGS